MCNYISRNKIKNLLIYLHLPSYCNNSHTPIIRGPRLSAFFWPKLGTPNFFQMKSSQKFLESFYTNCFAFLLLNAYKKKEIKMTLNLNDFGVYITLIFDITHDGPFWLEEFFWLPWLSAVFGPEIQYPLEPRIIQVWLYLISNENEIDIDVTSVSHLAVSVTSQWGWRYWIWDTRLEIIFTPYSTGLEIAFCLPIRQPMTIIALSLWVVVVTIKALLWLVAVLSGGTGS